ncbi:hypothetical protein [Kitasatospora sp. MBT66]|uniref:hypothetical protein n=1 Tax=Kitasatospora sp. MBT66 TaxID=1444769 RepID=UPI0007C6A48F|nr:hypothetical protein [Kitasatospora sp. MBT66]
MPQPDPSVRYDARVAATWRTVLRQLTGQWQSLGSWRSGDVPRFQRQALPAVQAGQRTIAALTASYLEQLYRDVASEPSPRVTLDMDRVTGAAVRNGTAPEEVYLRPFKVTWRALSDGEPLDVATERGANRLQVLAKTDLQLARTHAAHDVLEQQPKITYYLRTLNGEYDCALCLVASTQRYRKETLLPIHPGCDCGITTVHADEDPGQVVDPVKLDAIHRAVEGALGTHDRSARAVDYRQIIIANEHGEIGPVLSFRGHKFTGPDDLNPKDETPTPPEPKIPEPSARISEATRQQLDDVRASLPQTREDWLNDRRITHPAARPLEKRILEVQQELEDLQTKRDRIVADAEAEFKKRRTPRYKRDGLLAEKTQDVDHDIYLANSYLSEFRELAGKSLADASNSSERYFLQERPEWHEFTYRRDVYGRLLPPETYERHLDRVLEVGHALRDELFDAMQGDAELQRLRDELRSAGSQHVEVDVLREARRAVAQREAGIIHVLLRDIREMDGGTPAQLGDPSAVPFDSGSAPDDWEDQLREAFRHFPASWHATTQGSPLHIVGNQRAWYLPGGGSRPDFLSLSLRDVPTYDGAFTTSAAEIAAHELGHRMEQYVPGLRELEYTYVRRRATANGVLESPKNMADIYSWYNKADMELTYEDSWADAYTGKTYESGYPDDPARAPSEVFQVGLQDLFGRSSKQYGGIELQAFMLALLALL